MTTKPIDLAALTDLQADRYVPIDGIGTFRLQLLDARDKLALIALIAGLERGEDGELIDQGEAFDFGVELLSRAIVDESGRQCFATEAGRRTLERLPLAAMQELVGVATEMNGLGPGGDADVEGAEKN